MILKRVFSGQLQAQMLAVIYMGRDQTKQLEEL